VKAYRNAYVERLRRKALGLREGATDVRHLTPRAVCIAKPCAAMAVFVVPPDDREPDVRSNPYAIVQNTTATAVELHDWCALAYVVAEHCGEMLVVEQEEA